MLQSPQKPSHAQEAEGEGLPEALWLKGTEPRAHCEDFEDQLQGGRASRRITRRRRDISFLCELDWVYNDSQKNVSTSVILVYCSYIVIY